jgi:hypothetical protein
MEINYFQSKFESEIVKLIYKNYWLDTLSSNILLTNNTYYNKQIADMSAKIKNFNLAKSAYNIKNEDQNLIHQRKLDDIAKVNTQANVNIQNELLKTIIFNDK